MLVNHMNLNNLWISLLKLCDPQNWRTWKSMTFGWTQRILSFCKTQLWVWEKNSHSRTRCLEIPSFPHPFVHPSMKLLFHIVFTRDLIIDQLSRKVRHFKWHESVSNELLGWFWSIWYSWIITWYTHLT